MGGRIGKVMGRRAVEVVVHDDAVIVTGLGGHHLVLTPQAAERLASRLSGAAFAASCAPPYQKEEATARWTPAAASQSEARDQAPDPQAPIFRHRSENEAPDFRP